MINIRYILLTVLVVLSLSLACAPKGRLIPAVSEAAKAVTEEVSTKAVWEIEWDKTVQSARKEGIAVVYSSSLGPALKAATPLIQKKYGLKLEIISGKGSETTARLFTERRSGLYLADLIITGMNNFINETRPAGAADILEPELILPEVVEPKNWFGGKLPWGDAEHRVLMTYAYPLNTIAINSNLVKPAEFKSYRDLLNPKWKGKVIMNDPTVSGVGLKGFSVLAFHILDLDFFRQLAKQEPLIIRDQRLQVDWLAKEKYSILFFARSEPMTDFRNAGAPVAYAPVPVEGTYIATGGGNISLVNKAPHPKAARVLINWILSREGQTFIAANDGVQSARDDIPEQDIKSEMIRQPGTKYFLGANTEEWLVKDQEYIKAATEIFGHLMK